MGWNSRKSATDPDFVAVSTTSLVQGWRSRNTSEYRKKLGLETLHLRVVCSISNGPCGTILTDLVLLSRLGFSKKALKL